MSSYFPDVNVWLALVFRGHVHHSVTAEWLSHVEGEIRFCRFTQMGFLRLATNPAVVQLEVMRQSEAWHAYDLFLHDDRISFQSEPNEEEVESAFRKLTTSHRSATRRWSDAYLAAFATAAGLTVVTLDRGMYRLAGKESVLLV